MRDMRINDGRIGLRNRLVAILAAIVCVAAIYVWGVKGMDPLLWADAAVAAGVRPPQTIFPGFWRFFVGLIYRYVGFEHAVEVMTYLGLALGAVCVYVFTLIVRQILALVIRVNRPYAVWHNAIAPFFSGVAALCFGLSDPFWNVCRLFSPDEIRLVLLLGIIHALLRWFSVGGYWRLFPAFAAMGVLASETPLAFVLPVVFLLAYGGVVHCLQDGLFPKPERLPLPEEMPKWRMFFLFLGGLALSAWLNVVLFISMGGLEANGMLEGDIYFHYAVNYFYGAKASASIIGWTLGIGLSVLPFLGAIRTAPLAIRDDRQMPFNTGAVMFSVGFLGLLQSGAFPAARFWTFAKGTELVGSGFLLVFFVFCSMITLAVSMAAFAFECQRKYMTIEKGERPGPLLRRTVQTLALALLALVFVHLPEPAVCEMQRIVDEGVRETVTEAGDAKYLFTDGHLDAAVELEAASRGRRLYALNLMSGDTPWEATLRTRPFDAKSEEYKAAETGVPVLMRIWANEKKNGMDEAALQLGFEFWKREKKALPKCSGMVARTAGLGDDEARAGIARAKALSERILALAPAVKKAEPSASLNSAYSSVSWRLSRFARLREDYETADNLDENNSVLNRIMRMIEQERLRVFMQMTPYEGLKIALRRADFTEARRYAMVVSSFDEDNSEANFAIGMSELLKGNLKTAEVYLQRCLKRRPREAAVLNNLSILYRKQGRYKEAVAYAKKAIEQLPQSKEVKKTLADALSKAP